MIWVQGVDVEFAADVFGTIGAHDIEGEGSQSGEMPWFVSDTALIFEEADVPDIVITIFDAPMLPDGVTDGFGIQGDLAGIEGCFAGVLPKPGLGVLAPGVAGDADGGFDQPLSVGPKAPGRVEGFDEALFVPAMALLVDGQGCVDRVIGGRDGFDGIEQGLLIGFDLSDQEIAALSGRLKGFFDNAWHRP